MAQLQVSLTQFAPRDSLNLGIVRSAQDRIAFFDRLLGMPDPQFVQSECQNLNGRILVQRLGRSELKDRLVGAALFGQGNREIVMRHVIPVGDAQGIAPEGFIVAPVTELAIGEASQSEEHERGDGSAPHVGDSILSGDHI